MGRKRTVSQKEELGQLLYSSDAIRRLMVGEYPFGPQDQRCQEELQALYERLDYDYHPPHARLSKQLVYRVNSRLQIEIPDFAAFQSAIADVQEQIEASTRDQREEQIKNLFLYADRNLFDAIIKAGDDQLKVRELLDQACHAGIVLPPAIEAVITRKKPTDWWDFADFSYARSGHLSELRTLVKDRLMLWTEAERQQVLADIDTVDAGAANSAVWQNLVANVADACEFCNTESVRKKGELDGLLWHLMLARHQADLCILPEWGLHARYEPGLDYSAFQATVAKEAQGYLGAPWMHTPWLTKAIIATLLDAKLAPLSKLGSLIDVATLERVFPWFFWEKLLPSLLPLLIMAGLSTGILLLFKYGAGWMAWAVTGLLVGYVVRWVWLRHRLTKNRADVVSTYGALKSIRNEVVSGHYDADEVMRRLRALESRGIYVPSLTFSLLRIPSSSTAQPEHRQ